MGVLLLWLAPSVAAAQTPGPTGVITPEGKRMPPEPAGRVAAHGPILTVLGSGLLGFTGVLLAWGESTTRQCYGDCGQQWVELHAGALGFASLGGALLGVGLTVWRRSLGAPAEAPVHTVEALAHPVMFGVGLGLAGVGGTATFFTLVKGLGRSCNSVYPQTCGSDQDLRMGLYLAGTSAMALGIPLAGMGGRDVYVSVGPGGTAVTGTF